LEKFHDFDKYLHISRNWHYRDNQAELERVLSTDDLEEAEIEYEETKKFIAKKARSHPNGRRYALESSVSKIPAAYIWSKDLCLLEWIRHASNVSTQFRYELGELIWKRSHLRLYINEESKSEFLALGQLIDDRPAIIAGIKVLYLNVGSRDEDIRLDDYILFSPERLTPMLKTACKTLHLEILSLELYIATDDLRKLVLGEGKWKPLEMVQDISVTEEFSLKLTVNDIPEEDYYRIEDQLEAAGMDIDDQEWVDKHEVHQKETMEKYYDKLKNRILPNTLRKREPTTDVEKYLASRG
jgi:hypothetical protein